MSNNNNFNENTALGIFSTFLGVLNYQENLKQTSNDDLLEELKRQDKLYLDRIIEQNELIIKLLKEVSK